MPIMQEPQTEATVVPTGDGTAVTVKPIGHSHITLDEIKKERDLHGILVARKGQRLSVMPVEEKHFKIIEKMSDIIFFFKSQLISPIWL